MSEPFARLTVESITGNKTTFDLDILTCRKSDRLTAIYRELEGKQIDDPSVWPLVHEAIGLGVTGWNRTEPLTADAAGSVMSRSELLDFISPGGFPGFIQLEEAKRWKERSDKGIAFLRLRTEQDEAKAPEPAAV